MTQPNVHVRTSLSPEWDLSWWLWRLYVTAFSEWRPGTHATTSCELPPSHQAVPQVKNSVSWAWNLTPLLHVTRKHFAQFRETPTFPGMRPSREPERKLHVVSSNVTKGYSSFQEIAHQQQPSTERSCHSSDPCGPAWAPSGRVHNAAGVSLSSSLKRPLPSTCMWEMKAVFDYYKFFSLYFSFI